MKPIPKASQVHMLFSVVPMFWTPLVQDLDNWDVVSQTKPKDAWFFTIGNRWCFNFKVPYPATPWVLKTWSFFSTSTTLIKALLKDLDGSWMSGRWVAFPAAKLFPCWNCIGLTVDSKVDLKTRKDSRVITSESPKRGLYWFVCHMKFDEIWAVEERPPMLWGDPDLLEYDLFETMSQVHDRPENRN